MACTLYWYYIYIQHVISTSIHTYITLKTGGIHFKHVYEDKYTIKLDLPMSINRTNMSNITPHKKQFRVFSQLALTYQQYMIQWNNWYHCNWTNWSTTNCKLFIYVSITSGHNTPVHWIYKRIDSLKTHWLSIYKQALLNTCIHFILNDILVPHKGDKSLNYNIYFTKSRHS